MPWLQLALAIVFETAATSALKASDGFSRAVPALLCVAGYGCSFYLLGLALRTIPVGIAYAVWSGAGVVLISLGAWLLFDQRLPPLAWLGIVLIVGGVALLNLAGGSAH